MTVSPLENQVLQILIRRESLSLLQYTPEAFPWISSAEQEALDQLQKLVSEQARSIAGLQQFLARQHVSMGYVGTFPDYTGVNFIALDCLLLRLVAEQERLVAEMKDDLTRLGNAEALSHVQKFLDMKQHHLKAMQDLAARSSQTAVS